LISASWGNDRGWRLLALCNGTAPSRREAPRDERVFFSFLIVETFMLLWKRSLVAATLVCIVFLLGCGHKETTPTTPATNWKPKEIKNKGKEMQRDMPTPPPPPPPPGPPSK
jgi:hypothetical protein